MKLKSLMIVAVSALMFASCGNANKSAAAPVANTQVNEDAKPVVYMTKEITPEALVKIYDALGVTPSGKVAVKISTGEPGGHNFLQPSLIKDLVKKHQCLGDPLLPFQKSYGRIRRHRKLRESADLFPLFRGHVAHGTDHVEEP